MLKTPRKLLVAAVLMLLAMPAAAQDAADTSLQRRQPQQVGFQDQVNDVFGTLLGWFAYIPFYDIAGWFGVDTNPQQIRRDGQPTTDALALPKQSQGVQYAAFSLTDSRVLAALEDHQISVTSLFRTRWRADAEQQGDTSTPSPEIALLDGHTGDITSISMFPMRASRLQSLDSFYQEAEILSSSLDGTARVWRLCTAAEEAAGADAPTEAVTRKARFVLNQGAPVTAASYSNDGVLIGTGGQDGSVILWGADCQQQLKFNVDGEVKSIAFDYLSGSEIYLVHVVTASGSDQWYSAVDGSPVTPEEQATDAAAEPPPGYLGKAVADRKLQLESGEVLTLTDAGPFGDLSHDRTRALTWDSEGSVHVHDWLVRGPTGQLATVSIPFVVVWLVIAAVLFTLFFKFVNIRLFKHAIGCVSGKFSNPKDKGEVSHFQALSAALSATVGLGNIAGVAIAVMIGGPGATFWMIVAGLLGMSLKFTECTLGQKFRTIAPNGSVSGGPMHYLKDGLAKKGWGGLGMALAVIFSVFCIGGSIAGGNAFQVNQSLGVLRGQVEFFDDHSWVYGVIMAFFVGVVIIGGIKSIARVAEKIVPTMCSIYVLSALVLILMHLGDVPAAVSNIFSAALTGDAVYGGAIGALVMGFRRAAFSNEAGVGSASIAHSAARTPYAVREGIVALLEPFIDTVVVCSMTALVIGITGVYDNPQYSEIISSTNGAALTAQAFSSVQAFEAWFPWVLMAAVVLFAYSTMISWSYYGERCAVNLFGPKASLPFKILFLGFTVLGSIVTATNVLEFGDLMILLMAFPNILGLYFLGGLVKKDLADYEAKLKSGEIKAYR